MMHVLYALWLVKRHISGQSNVEQCRNQPVATSIVEVRLAEGISE